MRRRKREESYRERSHYTAPTDKLLSLERVKGECSDALSEGKATDLSASVRVPNGHGARSKQNSQQVSA